jgi:hypothetical protein
MVQAVVQIQRARRQEGDNQALGAETLGDKQTTDELPLMKSVSRMPGSQTVARIWRGIVGECGDFAADVAFRQPFPHRLSVRRQCEPPSLNPDKGTQTLNKRCLL